ncbi:MAG: CAP domain-containing protein, partial [Anaerolineales bacterium]
MQYIKNRSSFALVCGNMTNNYLQIYVNIMSIRNSVIKIKSLKIWIIAALLVTLLSTGTVEASASPPLSGGEVISAINGYRAAFGLSQLSTNAILTSAAQSQADYQASIQTVTHTGPGGSTARDRAIALGYNPLYLSEIIYGGWNATVSTALTWWQNSTVHNNVMLSSNYTEIGAGIAVSG